jgi:hypothetical protein
MGTIYKTFKAAQKVGGRILHVIRGGDNVGYLPNYEGSVVDAAMGDVQALGGDEFEIVTPSIRPTLAQGRPSTNTGWKHR